MAPRDPRMLLTDIIVACDRVAEFVADTDESSFTQDIFMRSAVER